MTGHAKPDNKDLMTVKAAAAGRAVASHKNKTTRLTFGIFARGMISVVLSWPVFYQICWDKRKSAGFYQSLGHILWRFSLFRMTRLRHHGKIEADYTGIALAGGLEKQAGRA
ncbi:hypothetical protein [Pseudophaeobacter sp.]|uniref:hypothetical protein n=1 Tax=Pseudophaeobacter sp. TaxID=1971739 RepID=UPI003298A310